MGGGLFGGGAPSLPSGPAPKSAAEIADEEATTLREMRLRERRRRGLEFLTVDPTEQVGLSLPSDTRKP